MIEDSRGDILGVVTISGHRRRGLVDGEQRVAFRPIRTEPESTMSCSPPAPQRAICTNEGPDAGPTVSQSRRYRSNEIPHTWEGVTKGTGGVFSQ